MKCSVCKTKLEPENQGETCGKEACVRRIQDATKWAKGAVDRILSHYTPEELETMRRRNGARQKARAL